MVTMLAVPIKPGKKQLNLWITEEADSALTRLAAKLSLRGRTQLAQIVLERYLAEELAKGGVGVGNAVHESQHPSGAPQIETVAGRKLRARKTSNKNK